MGGGVGCWQDWNDTFPNFPLIKQRHTRNDILLRRQPHPLLILTTSYLQHWTFNRIGWSKKVYYLVRGNGYMSIPAETGRHKLMHFSTRILRYEPHLLVLNLRATSGQPKSYCALVTGQ